MGLKQQLKQTLGMAMTPQLQQAIKILQMSVMELQQEVTNALVENPTLEVDDESPVEEGREREERIEAEAKKDPTQEMAEDFDWQSYMENNTHAPLPSNRNINRDELPNFEQILARPSTLSDHLMWQLRMWTNDPKKLEIGEEIIGNLNEDGYLMVLVEELESRLKVDRSEIEAVLFNIQRFDPLGVGARNLKECLLIQAESLELGEDCEQIIEKHLPELENKNYAAIAKAMDSTFEDVLEAGKLIHRLEPKPGRSFNSTDPMYITPDIYVVKNGSEFSVLLNEEEIPRLKISKTYQDELNSGRIENETRRYIKDKMKEAVFLMRSIHQRQKTIFRVTEAIVKKQNDFFERGPSYLKPMVLRDIAEELGLHESTISRVTTNKFVHTPHGIYELKYFFNSAISRSDGDEDLASESVKEKIKELVAAEDPKNPLSDQQLADMLKDTHIKIARRTVAKYREALKILPSNKRKKYF